MISEGVSNKGFRNDGREIGLNFTEKENLELRLGENKPKRTNCLRLGMPLAIPGKKSHGIIHPMTHMGHWFWVWFVLSHHLH